MASANDPPPEGGSSLAILRDPRKQLTLIAGGVIVLVIISMVGFSGAYFTSTSHSPGNEYVAAGMGLDLGRSGQIVDGAGMLPGDVRTGTQTVTNTGHLGALTLATQDLDEANALSGVLLVTIRQTDPAQASPVYDGALAGLESLPLGRLDADESRTYEFTVRWPPSQDAPELSGASVSLVFDWQLESIP